MRAGGISLAWLGPALEFREFRLWWLASLGMNVSLQMIDVAIGWQIYAQHHSTLDLGLVGLVEFVPMFLLAPATGQLADRLPRRTLFAASLMLAAAIGAGLAVISAVGTTAVIAYLLLALGTGVAMSLLSPVSAAMAPGLVPPEAFASAMTLRAAQARAGAVIGPPLAGVLFAVTAPLSYAVAAGACAAAAACVLAMRSSSVAVQSHDDSLPIMQSVAEGLRFVATTPVLLGAILLDLIGVLLGGAVALLPVFASTILHVGPAGLGVLRASPAVGALLAAAVLTRRPLVRRIGPKLLGVVAVFGASIVVFGFSHSYPLSLAALAVGGFADLYSMNIRGTIGALATPDRLRGRVGAVEMVFISASNELGAFESGLAASLLGTVPAVVGGGVLTFVVAIAWRWTFPSLAAVDGPDDLTAPENRLPDTEPVTV